MALKRLVCIIGHVNDGLSITQEEPPPAEPPDKSFQPVSVMCSCEAPPGGAWRPELSCGPLHAPGWGLGLRRDREEERGRERIEERREGGGQFQREGLVFRK